MSLQTELDDAMEDVHTVNVEHGWFDKDRAFGDDIALLHSEVSEAYEAYRKNDLESGPLTLVPDSATRRNLVSPSYNPSAMPAELADIFIRLLDTCYRYDINLAVEFKKKLKYNENRPYRHGGKLV